MSMCRVCRTVNQSVRQSVRKLSNQSNSQSASQTNSQPIIGRVVPIITIHAETQSATPSTKQSNSQTNKPTANLSVNQPRRQFTTHTLGNHTIERINKHDTDTIHQTINRQHEEPIHHAIIPPEPTIDRTINNASFDQSINNTDNQSLDNAAADESINQSTEPELQFMTPVNCFPDPEKELGNSIFAPLARKVAQLLVPYTETLGYKPIIIGRQIYFSTKGYIHAAPEVEKLLYNQTVQRFIPGDKNKATETIYPATPMSEQPSDTPTPQLVYDMYTREHPFSWLFMFVSNHRVMVAIHHNAALPDDPSSKQILKSHPLSADIPRVHQVLLESWWNDLSHALGETVGGLMLNKNLMQRQKRYIGAFYCFELAIGQSKDINELKLWLNSILALELYQWQKTSMCGPQAKLVDQLSDWLIDSLTCNDGVSDEDFAFGKVMFPVMPVIDPTATDYQLELTLYKVEDGVLMKVKADQ